MKRIGHLYEKIITIENLELAEQNNEENFSFYNDDGSYAINEFVCNTY